MDLEAYLHLRTRMDDHHALLQELKRIKNTLQLRAEATTYERHTDSIIEGIQKILTESIRVITIDYEQLQASVEQGWTQLDLSSAYSQVEEDNNHEYPDGNLE